MHFAITVNRVLFVDRRKHLPWILQEEKLHSLAEENVKGLVLLMKLPKKERRVWQDDEG